MSEPLPPITSAKSVSVPKGSGSGGSEPPVTHTATTAETAAVATVTTSTVWQHTFNTVRAILTGEVSNVPFENVLRDVVRVDQLTGEERVKATVANCERIINRTKTIIELVDSNFKAGKKDPFAGITKVDHIPMSAALAVLSGNTPEQIYEHNKQLYVQANHVMLAVQGKIDLRLLFDIDGCVISKDDFSSATHDHAAILHAHLLNHVMNGFSKYGHAKIMSNTNRAPFTTEISESPKAARNIKLDSSVHHSAMVELAGHSAREGYELLKKVGIGALSTGFIFQATDGSTRISRKMSISYELLNDALSRDKLVGITKELAEKYNTSGMEIKGLNAFLMLGNGVIEPDFKTEAVFVDADSPAAKDIKLHASFLGNQKIKMIEEECVDGTVAGWTKYREEILDGIEDRKNIAPILKRLASLYLQKVRGGNLEDGEFESIAKSNSILEPLPRLKDEEKVNLDLLITEEITRLKDLQLKSKYSEKPSEEELSLFENIPEVNDLNDFEKNMTLIEKPLMALRRCAATYIKIPGEHDSNNEKVEYVDSSRKAEKHINPFYALNGGTEDGVAISANPEWFSELINGLALTNICFHYDDPQHIQRHEIVPDLIERLREIEVSTLGRNQTVPENYSALDIIQELEFKDSVVGFLQKAYKNNFDQMSDPTRKDLVQFYNKGIEKLFGIKPNPGAENEKLNVSDKSIVNLEGAELNGVLRDWVYEYQYRDSTEQVIKEASFFQRHIDFMKWRVEEYVKLHYSAVSLEKSGLFKLVKPFEKEVEKEVIKYAEGVELNQEIIDQVFRRFRASGVVHNVEDIVSPFLKVLAENGADQKIVSFASEIFPKHYSDNPLEFKLSQEEISSAIHVGKFTDFSVPNHVTQFFDHMFYPGYLFARNYKEELTGRATFLPLYVVEDKRKDGLDYTEILCLDTKANLQETLEAILKGNIVFESYGDSWSDGPAHLRSTLGTAIVDGERIRGSAMIIYNLIKSEALIKKRVEECVSMFESAQKATSHGFEEYCDASGNYALEEVKEVENGTSKVIGYKKVIAVKPFCNIKDNPKHTIEHIVEYAENGKTFTYEDIATELSNKYRNSVCRNESPQANVRRLAEFLQHATGLDIDFVEAEFKKAQELTKKDPATLGDEEKTLVNKYRVALKEKELSRRQPYDTPKSRIYIEYVDPQTNTPYYRMSDTKRLTSREGVVFIGNEASLVKRRIVRDIVNNKMGAFVYDDTLKTDTPIEFTDLDFLNKVHREEEILTTPSPASGMLSNKFWKGLFGLGDQEKGKERIKALISIMPKAFSNLLSWSGAAMALGGLVRLASLPFGNESSPFKVGYWTSNIARGFASFGGALRGLLNPHRYYAITFGEVINLFSAVGLPNGLKHLGLAFGNTVLFTGRGSQSMQRSLAVNLDATDKSEKDPKALQTENTQFSSIDTQHAISDAANKNGLSRIIGDSIGSVASAAITPFKHILDIIKDPSLLKVKQWESQKSGRPFHNFKSVGHVLSLTGVLSGIGAVIGGFLGRTEKLGEVSESGFNSIGRWAIGAANAIPAIGIIANGLEVASSYTKEIRALDGSTLKYNARRAGLSQVVAGVFYAVLPWFDLSKDWVAAAFDTFGTGLFFGVPGTNTGVAEEEKLITHKQAVNMLLEGGEFFTDHAKPISDPKVFAQIKSRQYSVSA